MPSAWLGGCAVEAGQQAVASEEGAESTSAEPISLEGFETTILQTPLGPREVAYRVKNGIAIAEGDIELGPVEELESADKGVGFNARAKRWPMRRIPFKIDPALKPALVERVVAAINHWEDKTDIDFVARNAETEYVLFKNSNRCSSTSVGRDPGKVTTINLSLGKTPADVLGIGMYRQLVSFFATWYKDGTMSLGERNQLDLYHNDVPFLLPAGVTAGSIVSMDANASSQIYTWLNNGTFTKGYGPDLDEVHGPMTFTMPVGYNASQIVAMAFRMDGKVVTYYSNGKFSVGTPDKLDATSGPASFTSGVGGSASQLVDVVVQGNNTVVAYFSTGAVTVGVFDRLDSVSGIQGYGTTADCATFAVIHELGHAVGLNHEHNRCDRDQFVDIYPNNIIPGEEGNFATMNCADRSARNLSFYDFDSVMHYGSLAFAKPVATGQPIPTIMGKFGFFLHQNQTGLSAGDIRSVAELYGYSPATGQSAQTLIGTAVLSNGDGLYFYSDGTVTRGTPIDHDVTGVTHAYHPAKNKTISQIVAIDFSSTWGHLFAWYSDGTVSEGFEDYLDGWRAAKPFYLPGGYTPADIVAIAMHGTTVYYYYDDGKRSIGSHTHAYSISGPVLFYKAAGKSATDISEISIDPISGHAVTFYKDYAMSVGTNSRLADIMEAW